MSTVVSPSVNYPPTSIMDLPDDCLTFVFQYLSSAADREAFGLTCHHWLQMQNTNRHSLQFQCSITLQRNSTELTSKSDLVVGPDHLKRLLTRFPNLVSLSLSGCTELADSALMEVQHDLSKLRSLFLDCCFCITDAGLASFTPGCRSLSFISLYRCNVTDVGLESIAKTCSALEDIDLSYCQLITDKGVNSLVRNCRQLYAMKVSNCCEIVGTGFDRTGFDGCSLRYLEASACSLETRGVKAMVSGGGLEYLDISNQGWPVYQDVFSPIGEGLGSKLRFLNMRLCRGVGDESIVAIARGCPVLEGWNLALCHGIRLAGWEGIATNCHCLVKLHIYRCRNMCDGALMALRNGCKKLSILYMSGCHQVTPSAIEQFRMERADVEIMGEEIITIGPAWAFRR